MKWLTQFFKRTPRPSDNYSPRAQKLLVLTRKQADRLQHSYIGTEHLLLALIELQEGVGYTALQKLGLNPETLKQEIEARSDTKKATTVALMIPMTPRAKHVLKLADKEASELGHKHVGTEHIFLGLIRARSGIAAEVLKAHDVDLAKARSVVIELLPKPPAGVSQSTVRQIR